jgi:dTDP-4-dehydrorhamnose 3,5-epimerase
MVQLESDAQQLRHQIQQQTGSRQKTRPLWYTGPIDGVIWRPLVKHHDARGWLCELFREDELTAELQPAMCYLSTTLPGVERGPHEHREQADNFYFLGPSMFQVDLWDNRPTSPSYRARHSKVVGAARPTALVVPPGVVHAYRNVGTEAGLVVNCPNRLYQGPGRSEPVDEIRHELDPDHPFRSKGFTVPPKG